MRGMASESDTAWATHARLAELTVRLFFGLPEVFVMKALLNAPRQTFADGVSYPVLQRDDDIAERLQLLPKYVRLVLAALQRDGLVAYDRPKAKAAEGEEATTGANQSAPNSDQVREKSRVSAR